MEAYFKVGHTDQHNKQGASDIVIQTSKYSWSWAQDSNELIPEYQRLNRHTLKDVCMNRKQTWADLV